MPIFKEPTWCIDYVEITEDAIEIRGWAVHPEGSTTRGAFFINGTKFEDISTSLSRPDIERIFWWIKDAGTSGFCCRTPHKGKCLFDKGFATFSYGHPETGQPFRKEHNYYYLCEELNNKIPVPAGEKRTKVHGGDVESSFMLEGYSTFKKLEHTTLRFFNRPLREFNSILDWGCGCGRITRYFNDFHPGSSITGIDIDADNIQWCKENLLFGSFSTISTTPPTSLPEATFDLIIGISIFTHLKEKDEFLWLNELKRLAAPGGILLMTIHGMDTIHRSGLPLSAIDTFINKGFFDNVQNPNLDSLDIGDYYRNTFHTESFLKKRWSKYFKIIGIVPGYVGNHQDLVILQSKR